MNLAIRYRLTGHGWSECTLTAGEQFCQIPAVGHSKSILGFDDMDIRKLLVNR